MGGCQNYGPFLGTLNIRGRIIIGTQKGTIILTTTHIGAKINEMEALGPFKGYIGVYRDILRTPIMENQVEKSMGN